MAILLVGFTALAAWMWTRSFDKKADPQARFEIQGVRLRQDRSNVWLDLHLRKSGVAKHDLSKPVRLITADQTSHEAADTTFAGDPESGFTDIWFKFWLEEKNLEGPIKLQINDGQLRVKTSEELPVLDEGKDTVFKSVDWRKTWLGF